jgi:hypothetical protein
MSVYKKLSEARVAFLKAPVKKSGKNKFAGYEYFELGDFIPTVLGILDGHGLCGIVHFDKEMGYLDIVDSESGEKVSFTTPMVFASNPKGQAIQDLGSTHTYIRRYLWLMAMEIVEHDAVDNQAPSETPKPAVPAAPAPTAQAVEPSVAEVLQPSSMEQEFLVEKLTELATVMQTEKELTDLWKANQKQIDGLKTSNTKLFSTLKANFAEIKSNIKGA